MPTPTTYTYSLALDAPDGAINSDKLQAAIRASAITVALDGISTGEGLFGIAFKDALDDANRTILDGNNGSGGTNGQPSNVHPALGLIQSTDNTPNASLTQPVQVVQQQKTPGHYNMIPLVVGPIPAGETKYADYVVPNFTAGLDWHNAHFYAGEADSGDEIAAAKLILGQIASAAAPASQGDTTIVLVGYPQVLKPTSQGGAIDEGFYLSFGVENSSADSINTGDPTANGRSIANPNGELAEYRIKRIGLPNPIGNGLVTVTIELLSALEENVAQNTNANLVIRGIPDPIPLTKGDTVNIGGDVLTAGNMPAGSILRYGYFNNGSSPKTIRGIFTVLY
jgi:hypothetical protein